MKQHIKQPNYFGLTSSICSVASGLQWFADRSATGLQSVCNYAVSNRTSDECMKSNQDHRKFRVQCTSGVFC